MSKPVLYLFNGKVGSFGNAFFGFTPPDIYTVTLDTVTHGSITASPMSGVAGTTITLTSTPDTGYELDYFTVNGVAIIGNSFTMPAENVTVGAVLVEDPFAPVQIGDQIWTSKNLAIDDGGSGISTATLNYGQGDVVEHYYTWDAAVRVAASVQGWHLPSRDEWNALISYIGGTYSHTKLMSTYGWNGATGTDDYGFAAFPAGYPGHTYNKNLACFWTSTEYSSTRAYYLELTRYSISAWEDYSKTTGFSVRLIKDS